MSDYIHLDTAPSVGVPREPASDPSYIKHVYCPGARFHVLSWSTRGRHCSERDCIVNKPLNGSTNPKRGSSPATSVSAAGEDRRRRSLAEGKGEA